LGPAGAREAARSLLSRRLLRQPLQGREQQGEMQESGAHCFFLLRPKFFGFGFGYVGLKGFL